MFGRGVNRSSATTRSGLPSSGRSSSPPRYVRTEAFAPSSPTIGVSTKAFVDRRGRSDAAADVQRRGGVPRARRADAEVRRVVVRVRAAAVVPQRGGGV